MSLLIVFGVVFCPCDFLQDTNFIIDLLTETAQSLMFFIDSSLYSRQGSMAVKIPLAYGKTFTPNINTNSRIHVRAIDYYSRKINKNNNINLI